MRARQSALINNQKNLFVMNRDVNSKKMVFLNKDGFRTPLYKKNMLFKDDMFFFQKNLAKKHMHFMVDKTKTYVQKL